MTPVPGDVVHLGRAASPQFGQGTVTLRVTKAGARNSSVSGWMWLEGYTLDRAWDAVAKREVFVNLAGVTPAARARR